MRGVWTLDLVAGLSAGFVLEGEEHEALRRAGALARDVGDRKAYRTASIDAPRQTAWFCTERACPTDANLTKIWIQFLR